MNKTSLYEEHLALNAKMIDFAGWQMPIQYANVKQEVQAVRNKVGIFDVSHMGEFYISGPEALQYIDSLVPNDIANAKTGKAIYSPLCRQDGTIIDDLIIYKIAEDKILICVNGANIDKDYKWFQEHLGNFNCKLENQSDNTSLIAVQGPQAFSVLQKIDLGFKLTDMDYYAFQVESIQDFDIVVARTGYTGEDGFEIFGSHEYIKKIWSELIKHDAEPCGLAARDVLRLEVCFPLYGNELNDDVTPLDSALKWTVKMNKPHFIGKEALTNYEPKFQLIKLMLDKGIPRSGYPVENDQGQEIGSITSGTMSVSLSKGIAIARVDKKLYQSGQEVLVNIRGKKYTTQVLKKPFLTGGHK